MNEKTLDTAEIEKVESISAYEISDEALEAAAGDGLLVVEPTTMLAQPGCC